MCGQTKQTIELSPLATLDLRHALQTPMETRQEPFTLMVLGHQVVQNAEAKGLLLRTAELGDVAFSLPEGILQRLIADLAYLASSSAVSAQSSVPHFSPAGANPQAPSRGGPQCPSGNGTR
jgi:hypothetical protein